MKKEGYWKKYNRKFSDFDVKKILRFLIELADEIGEPFEKKSARGRSFKLSPTQYVALYILMVFFDMSLRDLELWSEALLGEHIDHSTFGKAFERIPEEYLKKYLKKLRDKIKDKLGDKDFVYLADATGVKLDRIYKDTISGNKKTKINAHDKLSILSEYYPDASVICISAGEWRAGYSYDSPSLVNILSSIDVIQGKYLYADAGYDGYSCYYLCFKKGLIPIIKQRKYIARGIRRKALEIFSKDLYKANRGIVEGIFGGLETKRLLFSRFKKEEMRRKHVIGMAICHNLQTYMTIFYPYNFLYEYVRWN